jgi:hypothetical protein
MLPSKKLRMMDKIDVINLSKILFDFLQGNEKDISVFDDRLSVISPHDFLIYNFSNFPESYINHNLMYAYKKYWDNFSLNDWKNLIEDISRNELALYTCLVFLYKIVKIDSIKLYISIPDLDEEIRKSVLNYFSERPGVLGLIEKYFKSELEKFSLTPTSFNNVRDKLILEGAEEAKTITPKIISL